MYSSEKKAEALLRADKARDVAQMWMDACTEGLRHPPNRAMLIHCLRTAEKVNQAELVGILKLFLKLHPAASHDQMQCRVQSTPRSRSIPKLIGRLLRDALMWKTLVGQSRRTHTLVRHPCRTPLFVTLLWDTLVCHFCGTLYNMPVPLVESGSDGPMDVGLCSSRGFFGGLLEYTLWNVLMVIRGWEDMAPFSFFG